MRKYLQKIVRIRHSYDNECQEMARVTHAVCFKEEASRVAYLKSKEEIFRISFKDKPIIISMK